MNPNDRKITVDSCPLELDSCPEHRQEGIASANTTLIKKKHAERNGVRLNRLDPSEHESFDKDSDNKIAQLAQEAIEKISAIKNDSMKDQQMSYRGYKTYEIYIRTIWPEAIGNIYTDPGGQIIARSNSFVSIERKYSTMWSQNIKSMYSMGHIRDKQDILRIMIIEFSEAWEGQLVSYGVIYDSKGRLVEPTCCIILAEYTGVMGEHKATRRQQYGPNRPLDIAFVPGEPYNFKISEDDIAMILRALSTCVCTHTLHTTAVCTPSNLESRGARTGKYKTLYL
jgi:hypothetical protein